MRFAEGLLTTRTVYEDSEDPATVVETSRRLYDFVKWTGVLTKDRMVAIAMVDCPGRQCFYLRPAVFAIGWQGWVEALLTAESMHEAAREIRRLRF